MCIRKKNEELKILLAYESLFSNAFIAQVGFKLFVLISQMNDRDPATDHSYALASIPDESQVQPFHCSMQFEAAAYEVTRI